MKKTYITPIVMEVRTGVFCYVHPVSGDGIHPQQEIPNKAGDPYSDNPNTSEIFSNERADFGSESGSWESLW